MGLKTLVLILPGKNFSLYMFAMLQTLEGILFESRKRQEFRKQTIFLAHLRSMGKKRTTPPPKKRKEKKKQTRKIHSRRRTFKLQIKKL